MTKEWCRPKGVTKLWMKYLMWLRQIFFDISPKVVPLISLSWVWHKAIYQEPRPREWWRHGKAVQHKHTRPKKLAATKDTKWQTKNAKDNTSKCWRHSRAIHNKHTVQSMARVRNYPDNSKLAFWSCHGVNHEINLRGQTCDRPYGHCGLSWVWVWSWVRPYNTFWRLIVDVTLIPLNLASW